MYFFGIQVFFAAGHVLGQTEDLEFLGDGQLDDLLEGVFGVAGAELARVAVVGEWHVVAV